MKKWLEIFENAVPGNHHNMTHREVDHQDNFCPTGATRKKPVDYFAHPNATSYYSLLSPSKAKRVRDQDVVFFRKDDEGNEIPAEDVDSDGEDALHMHHHHEDEPEPEQEHEHPDLPEENQEEIHDETDPAQKAENEREELIADLYDSF